MIFFLISPHCTKQLSCSKEAFEQLSAEIETNERTKDFNGRCFAGIMLDLLADYYGLRKKSSKESKAPFSGLIDWLEKLMG